MITAMTNEYSGEPGFIAVVGASAGGLNSIIELAAQLKPGMNLSMFVVLHLSRVSFADILLQRIQKNTAFTCKVAEDKEPIRVRHLYLAPPDRHLVLEKGKIVLGDGPAENRWRPSIDVLFRSAAAAYDGRVIGIILTGMMQDGTSGMMAIKRSGGATIVQDPSQAEYPDMPLSVMNALTPDYCLPLEDMGAVLAEKAKNGYLQHAIPEDVKAEAAIATRMATGMSNIEKLGPQSNFVCPDCGGGMWEVVGDSVVRYRCYTGHVFTQDELLVRQSEALENTLWVALRMLEERKILLQKMSAEERSKGWVNSAASKEQRIAELQVHIQRLKEILVDGKFQKQQDLKETG